jgi:hypothetical protein
MNAHEELENRLASNLRVSHSRAISALQVSTDVLYEPRRQLPHDSSNQLLIPEIWLRLF